MASYSQRGDQILAQVRIKRGGVVVFSESKLWPDRPTAQGWAERIESKIKKEGLPAVNKLSNLTVGALIRMHLQYQRNMRPLGRGTIHTHETMAQEFDKLPLADLRAKHLLDFAMRRKTQDKVAPATILADLSPVAAAVRAAPFAHDIRIDPTEVDIAMKKLADMGLTAKSRQVERLVDQAEEDALLEQFALRNAMPQTEIDMVRMYKVALALPRRVSELCRIRWADIDPKRRTIKIRDVKHPTKKIGNDQIVPLLGPAWDLMESTPKLDAEIFPYKSDSVSAAFERVRDGIAETGMPGIKDLRFHDLRHTGITMLFWRGLRIEEVAVVSGHTNWTQLKRYTHIKPEDLHRHFDAHDHEVAEKEAARWRGLKSIEHHGANAEERSVASASASPK